MILTLRQTFGLQQSSLSSSGKQLAAGQPKKDIRQKSTKDCGADIARLLGFDLLLNGALQKMEAEADAERGESASKCQGRPWLIDREKLVKLLCKQSSWA